MSNYQVVVFDEIISGQNIGLWKNTKKFNLSKNTASNSAMISES